MPRKGKRSEAQKRQRQRLDLSDCSMIGQCSRTQSTVEKKQVAEVFDAAGLQKEQVNNVTCVRASHSQADVRYAEFSRNRQCTCNALTFLSVLHEISQVESKDLDYILKQGDLLYTSIKKKLINEGKFAHDYLAFDELPDSISTNMHTYSVIKRPSLYGYLSTDGPDTATDFLKLSERLQCLSSDVNYALLTMRSLTIAVFRDSSGRYGFFDSHCRSPEGLVSHSLGTAVMLTFEHLSDMIERLLLFHALLDTSDDCIYEFMPVLFTCIIDSQQPNCSNVQSEVSEESMPVTTCTTSNSDTSAKIKRNKHRRRRSVLPKAKKKMSHEAIKLKKHTYYEKNKVSKLKYQKDKYLNVPQHKIKKKNDIKNRYSRDADYRLRQKLNIKTRYFSNAEYRLRQKSYVKTRYSSDAEYKLRQKSHVKTRYSSDAEYRLRQKSHVKTRYSSDAEYRLRQKSHVNTRYSRDAEYRLRKKSHVNTRYSHDADYRLRQKTYINTRYSHDADYRLRQKTYIKRRYLKDPEFQLKQKACMRSRYASDLKYKQKKRNHFVEKYRNDPNFKLYRIQHSSHKNKHKYTNEPFFRMLHKTRCALHIRRKYHQINLLQRSKEVRTQSVETVNPVMQQAIDSFQMEILTGPTHVCTSCHRAMFPNQVRVCKRESYQKNQALVSNCLTGKYVHVCNNNCKRVEQCAVPERMTEWICHSCHENLMRGNMPLIAVFNKLELAPIPSELSDLNILERHMIARYIPFAKIIALPKGQQRAIHGSVVCVPSEVESTVNALPRPSSQSQVLKVKLKRRMKYKGHYQFQNLDMNKILTALSKLKDVHSEYKNISIIDDPSHFEQLVNDLTDEHDVTNKTFDISDDIAEAIDLLETDNWDTVNEKDSSPRKPLSEPSEESNAQDSNDLEQDANEQNMGCLLDTCLQPADIAQDLITFGEGVFCVAPAEGNRPVSFFKVPKLEAMAFPVQFPTGLNTLDEMQRFRKVTPSRYFNARLLSVDNRFAIDSNYIFFAQFVTEMHLATSSMSIQLRKGKPITRDGRKITVKMLQDKHEVDRLIRNKDATRFMQPLRGTPAYWEKTLRDLFAMLRQLGTPTFFCTFSAAEMRWPEVIQTIKAQQNEQVNFSEMDWVTKCEALRSNPVTAMRMFDKRVNALLRHLLLSPAQPIGEVLDYFFRVEYQARGSPHIHLLAWCKNAPVFEEDPDETVCEFVDRYITCQLPDPNADPELYKIVTEVQIHSKGHSKSCKKGNKHCRFGFPKPPVEKTFITRPVPAQISEEQEVDSDSDQHLMCPEEAKKKLKPLWQLLHDHEASCASISQLLAQSKLSSEEYKRCVNSLTRSSVIMMKRQPKDAWVNGYNKHLLRAWNANIDIQYILNPYSCVMYILSYISKAEHEMSDYLKRIVADTNQANTSDRDEMKQIMQAYSKNREVSVQEAVARVCSLKLKSCSRNVIFVPTDDNALKMSLPLKSLNDKSPESENIWMSGLPEKYKNRPNTPDFETMCMAEFASTYRIAYGRQRTGSNVLSLQNGIGFIQKRTQGKPAIIRYARFSEKKYPEKFYATLLKLYLPYRSNTQLKPKRFTSYQSFYACGSVKLPGSDCVQSVLSIVNTNRSQYEKNNEAIEKAIEDLEKNGPMEDAWSTIAPETELIRLECISERDEINPEELNEVDDVPEYSKSPTKKCSTSAMFEGPVVDPVVLRQMYQNLNQSQASIFYTVRNWCVRRVWGQNPEQFFLFVTGGAGTGKSHLIKCIYLESSKILDKLPRISEESDISMPTVLLSAFTGTAAFNISGKTLHSILKLPRSLKPPYQGLGNCLDEVRSTLSNAEIIIIDEVSMVSKPLFAYINWRLQDIKGSKKPFGGMSVLAVGDFYQLPPPGKAKPLCVFEDHVLDFWQDLFQVVSLTEIMRQKEDIAFAELLNRLRLKGKGEALSEGDRALLTQAVTQPADCPKDVLHVFATNKLVEQHNTTIISDLYSELTNIDAHDYKKDLQTGRMEKQNTPFEGRKGELPDRLQVAVGACVMLIRNIDVEDGLVNGSFGKIVKIVSQVKDGKIVVSMLGVELDNPNAGQRNHNRTGADNLVYIERVEEPLSRKGVVRHQFPMKLAFACTVHKVQGMTTPSAVVSLQRIFEPGMAYVALSRTTSLSGLHIIDFNEDKIYADPEISNSLNNMKQASVSNALPLLNCLPLSSSPSLILIHHNTEGLSAHIEDVKSHHEICLADILCFTESHLSGQFVPDSLRLANYQMHKRNRHVSYSTHSHLANKNGGGVAIYVKHNIEASIMQYIQNVTDLEFLVLKVEAPIQALISVIYRPPDYSINLFLPNLCSLLNSLEIIEHGPVIICGDFNEDLLSASKKPIFELFQSRGYTQLITAATTEKNTLLDHVYISNRQHCASSGVLQTYYSYHNPVYCILA
ncbi:uncharacterized protein LOC143483367 [Brachyhypopomus gauderio]|uniref:uncharacterized protein LOC143483367 n=1 Tax=Brachyhypopomus gauderio TaxID=698409 RepID=UPI00404118FB